MRYVKMCGLLAMAAAVLMAFAGSASAGIFTTEKDGPAWTGAVHATAGETTLHGAATITCNSSTVQGEITQHGSEVTGKGSITGLTFSECNAHVTVKKAGTLEIHTHSADPSGGTYGIATSSGAEVSIQITSLGLTCVYTTNNTEVGTVTTSTHQFLTHLMATETKEPDIAITATIHINSAKIPRTEGSIFCGSSGVWTGTYQITTPDYLDYK